MKVTMYNILIRFDKYDYLKYGQADYWYLRATVYLLTCYTMEVDGIYGQRKQEQQFKKIYELYFELMLKMMGNGVDYENVLEEGDFDEPGSIDLDRAKFNRHDFLNYFEQHNSINFDFVRFRKFLSGEESPSTKLRPRNHKADNNPEIQRKMKELNELSHQSRNYAKSKIEAYIRNEMKSPCTCLSSQMRRHVIKAAKGDGAIFSLSYKTKDGDVKTITADVLKDMICNIYSRNDAKGRIHTTNRTVERCVKHGI